MDIRGSAKVKQHLTVDKNIVRGVSDKGTISGALTLNLYESSVYAFTLSGNLTLTLDNPTLGAEYTLIVTQDSSDIYEIDFPTSVVNSDSITFPKQSQYYIVHLMYNGLSYVATVNTLPIAKTYDDISQILVDAKSKSENIIFRVDDATGDPRVDAVSGVVGYVYYAWNGGVSGTISDFNLISAQHIHSKEIAFDDTGAPITADNVQDALTLIANSVTSTAQFLGAWNPLTQTPFLSSDGAYDNGNNNTTVDTFTAPSTIETTVAVTLTNGERIKLSNGVENQILTVVNVVGTSITFSEDLTSGAYFTPVNGDDFITAEDQSPLNGFFISSETTTGAVSPLWYPNDIITAKIGDQIIYGINNVWTVVESIYVAQSVLYFPINPSDWNTPPTNVQDALDELSSRITGLTPDLGSVVFVSENGDNTTAERGNILRPWQTIEAAADASQAGDLIWVFAGDFIISGDINLCATRGGSPALGQNWSFYFDRGVNINSTFSTTSSVGLFGVSGSGTLNIVGYAGVILEGKPIIGAGLKADLFECTSILFNDSLMLGDIVSLNADLVGRISGITDIDFNVSNANINFLLVENTEIHVSDILSGTLRINNVECDGLNLEGNVLTTELNVGRLLTTGQALRNISDNWVININEITQTSTDEYVLINGTNGFITINQIYNFNGYGVSTDGSISNKYQIDTIECKDRGVVLNGSSDVIKVESLTVIGSGASALVVNLQSNNPITDSEIIRVERIETPNDGFGIEFFSDTSINTIAPSMDISRILAGTPILINTLNSYPTGAFHSIRFKYTDFYSTSSAISFVEYSNDIRDVVMEFYSGCRSNVNLPEHILIDGQGIVVVGDSELVLPIITQNIPLASPSLATLSGEVSNVDTKNVIDTGFFYTDTGNILRGERVSLGTNIGDIEVDVNNLKPNTTYRSVAYVETTGLTLSEVKEFDTIIIK